MVTYDVSPSQAAWRVKGLALQDDRQTRTGLGALGQTVYLNGRCNHILAVQKLTGVQPPSYTQHGHGLHCALGLATVQGSTENRVDTIIIPASGRLIDFLAAREWGSIPDPSRHSLESVFLSYSFLENLNMQI